jgi:predicted NUDIX family phosphoesterase
MQENNTTSMKILVILRSPHGQLHETQYSMHHAANAANMTGYASAMVQGTYAQRRRGDAQNPVAQKQQILLVLITRHRLQVEGARW